MSELALRQHLESTKTKYQLIEDYSAINGTCRQGQVIVPPRLLRLLFGEPMESDGYKVSGEYIIERVSDGRVFTLYDWKSTTLYWDENDDAPTPEEFWNLNTPQQFNIGGRSSEGVCELQNDIEEALRQFQHMLSRSKV